MISASHNPYQDNGIKLFGPDGHKLSDEVELAIERRIGNGLGDALPAPDGVGKARRLVDVQGRYIEYAKATFPRGHRLDDLKIVVDCATGAAKSEEHTSELQSLMRTSYAVFCLKKKTKTVKTTTAQQSTGTHTTPRQTPLI